MPCKFSVEYSFTFPLVKQNLTITREMSEFSQKQSDTFFNDTPCSKALYHFVTDFGNRSTEPYRFGWPIDPELA